MKAMTYGEARQIARDLAKDTLENYWPTGSYPVDPVEIARHAGIEVYTSQLERTLGACSSGRQQRHHVSGQGSAIEQDALQRRP